MTTFKDKNILFAMSGSIACFKACALISELRKLEAQVKTVATKGALRFVTKTTIEGLSHNKVQDDLFASGELYDHIDLIKWADLIVLCPATASRINKLAAGTGDDLLGALFLAHDFERPFIIIPAMNSKMYHHPVVKDSINKLHSYGIEFFGPESGELACGENGDGRMSSVDEIKKFLEGVLGR